MSLITVPEIYHGDTLSLLNFLLNKPPGQIINLIGLKTVSNVTSEYLTQHMIH